MPLPHKEGDLGLVRKRLALPADVNTDIRSLAKDQGVRQGDLLTTIVAREIAHLKEAAEHRYSPTWTEGDTRKNVDWSKVPGVTAFVSPETRRLVEDACERRSLDAPLTQRFAPGIDVVQYPDGLWITGGLHVTLFQHSMNDSTSGDLKRLIGYNSMVFPYDEVFRLESPGGEVWQNNRYFEVADAIHALRNQTHDEAWLLAPSTQRKLALENARKLAEDVAELSDDLSQREIKSRIEVSIDTTKGSQAYAARKHDPEKYPTYDESVVLAALHEEIAAVSRTATTDPESDYRLGKLKKTDKLLSRFIAPTRR
ncbi:MAG TPA: hypothetical protein VLF68_01130 [Candidatus Saccharimonadales bacterium]|nr:hypothetical protein [Candidatus Saccharimonadales bacterium]